MTDLVLLARFGRAHGVKGEVRVQSFTGDPLALIDYNPLLAAGGARTVTLTALRPQGDMLVARVEGVSTREAAEALNGVELFVLRGRLPPAGDEDEFLLADLIGCEAVLADGTVIGRIIDVPNYGAGDLLDIRPVSGGPSVLMPFTRAFAPSVDPGARRVVIDPPDGLFGEP
jgi:16S rRNA processing protein RimM